ncbi:MAG: hypothetical protein QNJ64_18030 [Crocosphaera sp.]|nr:hypothetical protein [Crocosphaera sp.]
MAKFITLPFFSLAIVILTYGSFGWYVGSSAMTWSHWLAEQGKTWGWLLTDQTIFLLLHFIAGFVVLLISASLAAPVAIITFIFGSSFKSDSKAMIAVLLWSFAVVLMLRWITDFSHFLLLLCAAILAKLELEKFNYSHWKVMSILILICVGGFILGLLGYYEFKSFFMS